MYPIEVSDVIEYSVYLAASVCSEQPQDHDPGGLLAINCDPNLPAPLPSVHGQPCPACGTESLTCAEHANRGLGACALCRIPDSSWRVEHSKYYRI
jgi:hypothetical protein